MARLADELIERIKAEVSLVRLVEQSGVELRKQGKDYLGRCPFHDDRTPSLVVSPAKNLWHCLGACGEGGSVIDWVIKSQGVSFRHAVELLNSDHFTLAADTQVKKTTVPKLPAPVSEDADDQAALRQVIDYYRQTLKQSPEAKAYLAQRGLDDTELIERFRLGHANRTLGLRLPHKNRKAGAAIREQLQRIGLYRDTGREHFNGSLVIPVMDGNGVISEVYGRKLLDTLRKGTPKHLYLPGPHRGVFNLAGIEGAEEVILCESLIDALTFWRWGFRQVTSSFGTNGFTDEILQALIEHKVKRVLIAYDRDAAGDKAAAELAEKLMAQRFECFRILFPKGMDANEYALQVTPAAKSLGLVIRKAEWMGSGKAPERQLELHHESPEQYDGRTAETQEPQSCAPEHPAKARFAEQAEALAGQIDTLNRQAETPSPAPESPAPTTADTDATPVPPMPRTDAEISGTESELFIALGDRVYRVRGLEKNTSYDQLKIQLLVRRGDAFHMDKLDLTSSKQRQVFINQASVELGLKDDILKKDLGKVLLALEEQQAKRETAPEAQPTELAATEREEALALLQDQDLLERILDDFNQAGVVGEEINKLAGYLSCVSRKLDRPLAVMIQSSSAAGKSSLMDAILALMPEDERVQYSAMTGQSLFYMGETNLKHKILAISEEEGASNASYALKLLQSEGEVTIASTGKDEASGELVTREYRVEGPVMLFMTTTAIDIDEELLNRCIVLTVNEDREQTRAIHQAQRARRTLQGLHNKLEKERIVQLHRNAQHLLKPLAVINPYADQLTFLDDKTRTRRDHEKYLTLIDSIALLHQYQREIKALQHNGKLIEYVEVTLDDIATANRLAHDILGRTLDELPPQTRKLLTLIGELVDGECEKQKIEAKDFRFSRRQVRSLCGWSETQVRVHIQRLVDMEYLLTHRGGRGQSFEYELLYRGEGGDGSAFLMGLLDTAQLKSTQKSARRNTAMTTTSRSETASSRGNEPQFAAPSRSQRGGLAEPPKPLEPSNREACSETSRTEAQSTSLAV